MHYYHIKPNAVDGNSFHTIFANEYNLSENSLVLEFHQSYLNDSFFVSDNHFFFLCDLKNKIESNGFAELSFSKVDKLILPLDPLGLLRGKSKNDFWKVDIPSDGSIKDFYLWNGIYLVVSQKALDFLVAHNGFKDLIGGIFFGKEYEYLSNRFYIENGDMEKYFSDKYNQDLKFVENKSNLAMGEYRRRKGLPPLKR